MTLPPSSAAPVVHTRKGAVRGIAREGSAAFLGIPYAEAPVGERRFAAPVPPEPWEGVRDATAYGPTPQRGDSGTTLIPEPSVPGEATLNVNVFTPRPGDTGAGLPVMVYFHGGGFYSGSPASPWYDGAAFARDGVVTVTVSYRLGFDGFGLIEGAPTNRGVLDWLAALTWVRDEITAFGGDPGRVTIAGQSAGGGAVLTLLALPAARGLFHSALAISPVLAEVDLVRAAGVTARMAKLARVRPHRDGFATVPEERIVALQRKAGLPLTRDWSEILPQLLEVGLPWGPVIDGELIRRGALAAFADGAGADVPLVMGTTDDEFTMTTHVLRHPLALVPVGLALSKLGLTHATKRRDYLLANLPHRRQGTAAILGRYATDRVFRSVIPRVAAARGAAPTWVYRFSWPSPVKRWAIHCLDVPFWFDCLDAPGVDRIAGDHPPQALAREVHGAAVAFIEHGDPGWEPWSSDPGRTRVFGGSSADPDTMSDGYSSLAALL